MNKFMPKWGKPGFSLAEALITLLIVCLITLASIPILTKKRRSLESGNHGKWMCSLNSSGKYVTWSTSEQNGDVDNPDTWSVSANQESCIFTPPVNGKNYTITLIGGGAAGADGVSERIIYMDNNKTFFVPSETKNYRLAIVGGGGGGRGSDDEDEDGDNYGVGGQGGGGAYWVGTVEFLKDRRYTSSIASGAEGKTDGGTKDEEANSRNVSYSSLKMDDNDMILAGTGEGGKSTRNRSSHSPDKGGGGIGGSLVVKPVFDLYSQSAVLYASEGKKGKNGGKKAVPKDQIDNGEDNGIVIPASFWGDNSSTQYGRGGNGKSNYRKTDRKGDNGGNGIVLVWEIKKLLSKGGAASPLSAYTFPELNGQVVFKIGRGGGTYQHCYERRSGAFGGTRTECVPVNNGEITTGNVLDSGHHIARVIKSMYGAYDSETFSASSAYNSGYDGENSQWNNKGGGIAGNCQDSYYQSKDETVTYTDYDYDSTGERKCKCTICNYGFIAHPTTQSRGTKCPYSSSSSEGACISYYQATVPGHLPSWQMSSLNDRYKQIVESVLDEIDDTDQSLTASSIIRRIPPEIVTGTWHFKLDPLSRYLNPDSTYPYYYIGSDNCSCYVYKTKTYSYTEHKSEFVSASCQDSGNGTYFGAGGASGGTTDKLGVVGKGGSGAHGAAIVEW